MKIEATLSQMLEDCNWRAAFHEAVYGTYGPAHGLVGPLEHVVEIYASANGEHGGDEWIAVGKWDEGQYFVMAASCDYTGWYCQAGGMIEFFGSLVAALANLTPQQASRLGARHDVQPRVPSIAENPDGLHQRYSVTPLVGEPDPNAIYFVLRLDNMGDDPGHLAACRQAALAYCDAAPPHLAKMAQELRELVLKFN